MNHFLNPATLPLADIQLNPADVHIWQMDLNGTEDWLQQGYQLLSADERQRADRIIVKRVRNEFIAAHAALRNILARYLNCSAQAIHYEIEAFGKPRVSNKFAAGDFHFNLSHSGDFALCAISQQPIGIDVESMRRDAEFLELAQRFFAPQEFAQLRGLTADDLRHAFYRCWTLKEAYIKLSGLGMHYPLEEFAFDLLGPTPTLLTAQPEDPFCQALFFNTANETYAASLAVLHQPNAIQTWLWDAKF